MPRPFEIERHVRSAVRGVTLSRSRLVTPRAPVGEPKFDEIAGIPVRASKCCGYMVCSVACQKKREDVLVAAEARKRAHTVAVAGAASAQAALQYTAAARTLEQYYTSIDFGYQDAIGRLTGQKDTGPGLSPTGLSPEMEMAQAQARALRAEMERRGIGGMPTQFGEQFGFNSRNFEKHMKNRNRW